MKNRSLSGRGRIALVSISIILAAAGLDAAVVQDDPEQLPPLGGPGWYSLEGAGVSYYVDYGPDEIEEPFAGVLFAAENIVVDNFQGVTRTWDGNDLLLSYTANLSATITVLLDFEVPNPANISIPGTMTVRLSDKLGKTTGTFPLTIDAMSFSLKQSDIFEGSADVPFFDIRSPSSPPTTGRTIITDLGGGMYENDTILGVASEAAFYNSETSRWLPYFPDTNQPTPFEIRPLQPPRQVTLTLQHNETNDVVVEFKMRPHVRYTLQWSPDLRGWSEVTTAMVLEVFEDEFSHTIVGGHDGARGYARVECELIPFVPPPP